jgi:signal transduction histidine kinase/HAMP domain-containing protein
MNVKTSLKKFLFENFPLSLRARLLLLILGSLLPLLVLIAYLASQNSASPAMTVSRAGGAAILSVGLALFLSNRVVFPIRQLIQAAKRVSAGDFAVRVDEEGTDEISELSQAFNKLATNLQSLRSINSVTLGTQDLDQLLHRLLESVVASTRTEGGAIALVDLSTDEIVTESSFRLPPDLTQLRHKIGEGLLGRVVVTGQPVVVSDAQHDLRVTNPDILALGVRSLVVLPLKTREKTIGVVYVVSMERREFSEADLRILEIMTDRAALAIENARLLQESRSNEKFHRALLQVSAAINSVLSLDRVLDIIAKEGERLLEVDLVNIWIAQESEMVEMATSNKELNPRFPMRRSLSDQGSLTVKVFQSAQTISLNDIPGQAERPWIRSQIEVRSLMAVPMVGFTRELAQRAEILVQQAAIAIQNARFFGELEERRETLEILNRQLTQANKCKDEFLGIISHELRTPLNVITGSTDLLLGNFLGELTAEQRRTLQIASKNAADLLGLINGILDLYRLQIGERPVRVEEFHMEDLCAEIEESFRQTAKEKGLNFTWRYERIVSPLRTDRLKLKELLHNLVSNAIKFTEQGKVEVRVVHEPDEDRLRVEVEDTGIGMDKEVLPFVFDPFQQGDSSITRKYGGAGLGLTIVKRLLDLLGGEIEIQSEPGKGSLFRCRLPTRLETGSSRLSA